MDGAKLRFSFDSLPIVKSVKMSKDSNTFTLNGRNNYSAKVSPTRKPQPVDYVALITFDVSRFQKKISESTTLLVTVPGEVMTQKVENYEMNINVAFDTQTNEWNAQK
jgi:hypothetical protein